LWKAHQRLSVVTKSTVPVGTSQKVKQALQEELDKEM
jgi:UDPglucose 6-dehydrogenase